MITSTSSAQVRHVVQLQKKGKARRTSREFVVEGSRMVQEAPPEQIVKVYQTETFADCNPHFIEEMHLTAQQYETVSDHVFLQMSDTQTPQGILAVIRMHDSTLEKMLQKEPVPLLLLVENLQDPGNLGTILRMGEGAGVTGVIMSPGTVDIYNPKTIRSTMGSIYRMPFLYADRFAETVQQVKDAGISIYAAHLDGTSSYAAQDYTGPSAFLIGNEGNGLSPEITRLAGTLIRIPMKGKVESLNAAVACTVLSYEASRQREPVERPENK